MANSTSELIKNLNAAPAQSIPDALSTVDKAIDHMAEFAKKMLIGTTAENDDDPSLVPMWMVLTKNGNTGVVATPFDSPWAKDLAATMIRQIITEAAVIRYTFASETWMAKGVPGMIDLDTPPSQQPTRIEVLMVSGGDRSVGEKAKFFRIVRDGAGKVIDLPFECEMGGDGSGMVAGRFSSFLTAAN